MSERLTFNVYVVNFRFYEFICKYAIEKLATIEIEHGQFIRNWQLATHLIDNGHAILLLIMTFELINDYLFIYSNVA